jgi:hypothetical protein
MTKNKPRSFHTTRRVDVFQSNTNFDDSFLLHHVFTSLPAYYFACRTCVVVTLKTIIDFIINWPASYCD